MLTQATAIEEAWLKELFPADCVDEMGVVYDTEMRRVIARRERRFRDLVLETKPTAEAPPAGAAAALLAAEVLAERVKLVAWDEGVEQ